MVTIHLKDYDAKGVVHITNKELLTSECDILVPAALENTITEEIASVVSEFGCTYRMAAYIVALRKLIYAEEIKGIFP